MKFVIECSIKILAQIILCEFQSPESHLGRFPSLHTGNIGPSGCKHPEQKPYGCRQYRHCRKQAPEQAGPYEEIAFRHKNREFRPYISYILSKALHPVTCNGRNRNRRSVIHIIAFRHGKQYCPGLQSDIFSLIDIIITVWNRGYRKIPMAARYERVFISLASRSAPGSLVSIFRDFRVIHFEIRRECDMRGLKKGHIAFSLDSHYERRSLMRRKGILAQPGRNREVAHSSPKRSRCPGRKRCNMHFHGRRIYSLPDSPVVIKESVEYTCRASRGDTYVQETYKFGRLYCQCAGLLRYQDIFTENSSIVYPVIVTFPLELDIGRCLYFLAPEPVE